ncbi:MAG: DPP IV N-terminal domain-containing protein [Dysgonamonadaceae bacterium]|nr:DPP IV N-terminal domain-containing protein [Dysgonamonadaceae bacterium]MDD3308345.1 DPP IV N-terminal domain-containing protein [Dysgonamonadaceae bacterium]MDD3900272.1 DPP IV N-terminal domain-containing protein [Dysgonamonadaceae bacterium]MDD4398828.1 DPP IV N-terminal domain-containing protein [Dysgonamonadaceae bacterium]
MIKIKSLTLSILVFFFAFSNCLAQQTRWFTLEELIPGGVDFYTFYPRHTTQYQWHGDQLVQLRNDSVWISDNPMKQTEKVVFTFSDIEDIIANGEDIYHLQFPLSADSPVQFFSRSGSGFYDIKKKQPLSFFTYPDKSENHDISVESQSLAYNISNNLYILDKNGKTTAISSEENKGIVYGQAVHRNEFGITKGTFWSPTGNKLAFYRMDETMVTDYPLVDTSTRIAEVRNIKYPMAGMTSHEVTVGIYDISTGKTIYLQAGDPKDRYFTNIGWSPDEKHLFLAELNRDQNQMKLLMFNATTGELEKLLFEEQHPKYVEPENPVLFVPKRTDQFIWQSKRDGHNHLYLYDVSGKLLKQLTSGNWDVTEVIGFDEKGNNLFFASTNPTPMDRHIYKLNLKNGKSTKLTTVSGIHNGTMSQSGKYLLDRFSSHNNPGMMYCLNTNNNKLTELTSIKNPYSDYLVPTVNSGTIKAADSITDLHYRFVKPADFDPAKKYPVVIYVYGGPHSQMVQNSWRYGSGGWEFYMAQKGYLVFVMDNRGTSNRGLDFENVTFRKLGIEESLDQMEGVKFLRSLPYVDHNRLGIHGWSYGGFMTINMLLRYPDVFKVGVAGGPVIDWKYYEVMYGERYMDTPQQNASGYEETSLLNKADKLKGRLLIIHGDNDPTVVWQNSIQFLDACIAAGTHPDYFIYPGHGHNMIGHDRVHLHEHITRYFDDFME